MRQIFFLALAIMLMTGCADSRKPFTQKLYNQSNLTANDLKKVQFYTSGDIVLTRELQTGSTEVTSGKIKMKGGKRIDEVVIKKGTPGIVLFSPKQDRLAISFENDDNKYLIFGPNPNRGKEYVLLASEWKQNYGIVSYDGKEWETPSSSAYATLVVDVSRLENVTVKSRSAGGRTVK